MKGRKAALEATVPLTDEQIEFFHGEGYLLLDAIATPGEIERLRGIYDRLFETEAGRALGDLYDLVGTDNNAAITLPQLMHPSRYAPEIAIGQFRVNASAIACQLLGPKYQFAHDMAICKTPGSTAETPWHQDFAYHDPRFDVEGLMIWVPLQQVTADNGCLRFIPKSHLSDEVLPHHPINDDPRSRGLECDSVDVSQAVLAPLPLGGASIHHSRTLHSAGPNKTPFARRAYILEFRLPPQRRAVPRNCYWQPSRKSSFATRAGSLGALVRNTLFLARKRIRARIKPQR